MTYNRKIPLTKGEGNRQKVSNRKLNIWLLDQVKGLITLEKKHLNPQETELNVRPSFKSIMSEVPFTAFVIICVNPFMDHKLFIWIQY